MERLRDLARQEQAPADLLRKTDLDLLGALDVLRDGKLTRAAVLIAGQAEAIVRLLPNYGWTHERMKSATAYLDRADGRDTRELALPLALAALESRINADNPITTVEHGLYHFEFRAYPAVALREALLNGLSHLDLRLASPVLVKQYPRRLEITNPGGFIGGITPTNILHHPPLARNPLLVQALSKLRLVNRSNLGIGRMFEAMLIEGKEPPHIIDEESAAPGNRSALPRIHRRGRQNWPYPRRGPPAGTALPVGPRGNRHRHRRRVMPAPGCGNARHPG
jgi:ATP-dependent DNA helicase RecG